MLRKESIEVIKQSVFFILGALFVPGFLLITTIVRNQSYFQVFFPIFQVGLIFWAMFLGVSLFSSDRGQRGMEYLLSLPYSRLKLVGLKTVPRGIAVLFFYLVFLILYLRGGINAMALSFISFTVIYFSLYLIALSLSSSSENFIILSIVSLFSLCVYLWFIYLVFWTAIKAKGFIYYELEIRPFFVGQEIESIFIKLLVPAAVCILLPPLLSFILSFKKFDMRPSRIYNKRYFKFFAPLFILGLIASFLFAYQGIDLGYSSYYLTQNHKLIEYNSYNYSNIKIYDNGKVFKIKGQFDFYRLDLEDNEYVYAISYWDKIIRLSTSKLKMEVFYEAPRGHWLEWGAIYKYEQTIAFIENIEKKKNRYAETQLVLIDEPSKKITRIPFDREPLKDYYHPVIFGADRMGDKTFWLVRVTRNYKAKENPIVKLWEDGKVELVGESEKFPCYANQLLITYAGNEIIISNEKDGKFELIRKIPNPEGFMIWKAAYREENLSNVLLKEIYCRKFIYTSEEKGKRKYTIKCARLNLENFELEEIKDFKGELLYFYPDDYYAFELDEVMPKARFYSLKEGKLNFIKELTAFDLKSYDNIGIFRAGVVLKKGKKVRAYAFPDLRELKFKKL
jgi:hypothetical protein